MNKSVVLLLVPLLLLLLSCATTRAQTESGNPENWCRNGAFPGDAREYRMATIAGRKGERAYFYSDDEDCPSSSEAKCRRKAYVMAGDRVLVSRRFGPFMCGWYQPARGSETVGWLPVDKLSLADETTTPRPEDWLGEWTYYSNSVKITRPRPQAWRVDAEAFWYGVGNNVHTGGVNTEATLAGNVLTVEDDICHVKLMLVGEFLVVNDNGECGGLNVTLDGIYRRKSARRAGPATRTRR